MVKGCQREMVMIQTGDSPFFESAWLVLRQPRPTADADDMLTEANRIVGAGRDHRRASGRRGRCLLLFSAGFLIGAALSAGLLLLLCI